MEKRKEKKAVKELVVPKCPYQDKVKGKRLDCDNRIGLAQMTQAKKFTISMKFPDMDICTACMEGKKTRNYIKTLFEHSGLVKPEP